MCATVNVGDKWCDNQGELKAALGGHALVYHDATIAADDDDCCCPVDMYATAAAVGMVATMNEVCDWVLKPEEAERIRC